MRTILLTILAVSIQLVIILLGVYVIDKVKSYKENNLNK